MEGSKVGSACPELVEGREIYLSLANAKGTKSFCPGDKNIIDRNYNDPKAAFQSSTHRRIFEIPRETDPQAVPSRLLVLIHSME